MRRSRQSRGTSRPPRPPELDPLLDTAPSGFLVVDDSGVVQVANRTLATLLGHQPADLIGQHVDILLPAAGRIFYSTHLFPLLRLHGHAEELYVPMRHRDGTDLPVMVNGAKHGEGADARYHLAIAPMRQRNLLEDELIQARNAALEAAAAKDRFLSVVSHELRSPLAGIMGYAQLLLMKGANLSDDQRRYAERILDAARYQVTLIEEILDFARLGESRDLTAVAVSVEEVLSRVLPILEFRATEAGRRVELRPAVTAGAVMADARAVQQIVLNLGINAIKYGSDDSTVVLDVERADKRVRIGVTDMGPGIPADQLERIFQPFVRLEEKAGDADRRPGVGLGLAISRDLARAMGGDIHVQSQLGRGSTFTLELPAA